MCWLPALKLPHCLLGLFLLLLLSKKKHNMFAQMLLKRLIEKQQLTTNDFEPQKTRTKVNVQKRFYWNVIAVIDSTIARRTLRYCAPCVFCLHFLLFLYTQAFILTMNARIVSMLQLLSILGSLGIFYFHTPPLNSKMLVSSVLSEISSSVFEILISESYQIPDNAFNVLFHFECYTFSPSNPFPNFNLHLQVVGARTTWKPKPAKKGDGQ